MSKIFRVYTFIKALFKFLLKIIVYLRPLVLALISCAIHLALYLIKSFFRALVFFLKKIFRFSDNKGSSSKKKSVLSGLLRKKQLPPPIKIFGRPAKFNFSSELNLHRLADALEEKLRCFGITGEIVNIKSGPVINLFEFRPEKNVKISRILALEHDLSMALRSSGLRIVAPVPGKNLVGFEIGRKKPEVVEFVSLLSSDAWKNKKNSMGLPVILGVDSAGVPIVEDLCLMPHLLIAGSTGSGKSVCVHTLMTSFLINKHPDDLKLILIDPKRLEFSFYFDIPHLVFPVITEVEKSASALKWAVEEMNRRYQMMSKKSIRDIAQYNKKAKEKLPLIVIVIDELADLVLVGGKAIESSLIRLAQMARAAGIHLVVATQRPSVDVVTGLIKVNFPSRVAFRVSSKIDSRTIIDAAGSEKLLGKGDMLFLHPAYPGLRRLNGALITTDEIELLTDYLRSAKSPDYEEFESESDFEAGSGGDGGDKDPLYNEVVGFVQSQKEISISMLQRRFKIGFNRSARLIEDLEENAVVSPARGSKPRKVL